MGYGFVIDHTKCIGCHACTVACKSENEVPLGAFRTWVKYTEKGTYPVVRRHFTVLRCNHCDAAPCVEICPVTALSKRPDAIVDLDRDVCIGCKACMQACPYDAIYLNEDKGVAEKCHYCAHRTEIGLEPACVVVCPVQAIVAGDADDPETKIASLIANETTSQRKPEKETKPRVWYIDALDDALIPGRAGEPTSWLWSDRSQPRPELPPGYEPPADLVTTLNVDHAPVWGWHVWAYLVTKNLSAGTMMLAPFLAVLGIARGGVSGWVPEVVALVFLGLTTYLLIADLGRPERFWRLLLKPNTKSWLVKGAWVLSVFGALTTAALGARLLGQENLADVLRWLTLPWAAFASGYSAWLFKQCRGRDLWLESGLLWQLLLRAAFLGAGVAMLLPTVSGSPHYAAAAFISLGVLTAMGIFWERMRLHKNPDADRAESILRASFSSHEGMSLVIVAAVVVQVATSFVHVGDAVNRGVLALGLVIALLGMLMYERAWIRAGQSVPNS
ncbi:MAG: 4Fe-4S dicluster domain-containing protein [Planctomycetes bacterium]|nr:4Fe-4S dicluster domain-containing protein [Planctomycetota bacterium]